MRIKYYVFTSMEHSRFALKLIKISQEADIISNSYSALSITLNSSVSSSPDGGYSLRNISKYLPVATVKYPIGLYPACYCEPPPPPPNLA